MRNDPIHWIMKGMKEESAALEEQVRKVEAEAKRERSINDGLLAKRKAKSAKPKMYRQRQAKVGFSNKQKVLFDLAVELDWSPTRVRKRLGITKEAVRKRLIVLKKKMAQLHLESPKKEPKAHSQAFPQDENGQIDMDRERDPRERRRPRYGKRRGQY
jgi:hypothetical protein